MSEWADFHRPAYRDWRWLETCWFGFFVPEHRIRGHMRAAFRINQDVAFSMVNIFSRGGDVLDMDFFDSQMHVPIGPVRYSDFALASGLTVRGRPAPDRYAISFRSRCRRVVVETEHEALMPPATLDVTALADAPVGFAAFHREAKGDAPVGHVDQTFRVRGTLTIDGDHYDIDCVSNHDRSWSPRSEFNSRCGTFDNFHFGEEMTFLAQAIEQPFGTPKVTQGYVLLGRELRRVTRATVRYERAGLVTTRVAYEIEDETGARHSIEAPVIHAISQDQGSNGLTVMNYCEPRWNGRTGYGESMWHWDIPEMQRLVRDARKRDPDAPIARIFDHLASADDGNSQKGW